MPATLCFPFRRRAAWLAAWCLTMALTANTYAWNASGHMIVASFAYDQLSLEARGRMLAILEANPSFAKWKDEAATAAPGVEFGRYVLMRASIWPDDIRQSGSPYDHPIWHYAAFPLLPPDFPMEEPPAGTENILTASAAAERTLTDPAAPAVDRAAALSWIVHLVGDVMQPLHGATMISAAHPRPDGDREGGLFFVDLGGNAINLHMYWDRAGETDPSLPRLVARAGNLEKAFPRAVLPELDAVRDMRGWALESRQLAIDTVYLRGQLPGSVDPQAAPPPLPGDYAATARRLAERRLALAGYRLADVLTRLKP